MSCLISVGAAAKVFAICQFEKMLIPPARNEIPRLHRLLSGYLNGKKANQGCA